MKSHTLLAAVIRMIMEEQIDGILAERGLAPITVQKSKDAYRAKVTMTVLTIVGEEFGISPASIRGSSRPQPQALARQICLVLLREVKEFDRRAAVAAVGLTDPTSFNTSARRVAKLVAKDPEFAARLERLRQAFTSSLAPAR